MTCKFKLLVASLMIAFSGLMLVVPSLAAADSLNAGACAGLNALNSGSTDNTKCSSGSQSELTGVISFVVQTLSWVAGIAGVIMVIVSGFRYITAGGDSGKISNARQTLTYALIGLVVAVLAQVLVHFVINNTNRAVTACSSAQPNISKSDPSCKTPG